MNNMYGLGTYGASSFVDTFFGTSSTSGGSLLSSIGDLQMIQKGAYKKAMKAYVAKLKSSDSAETIKNSGTADSGTKLSGLKSSSQKLYQAANDLKNASYGDNTKAEDLLDKAKNFVSQYNSVLGTTKSMNSYSILQTAVWGTEQMNLSQGLLNKVGITINDDNTLSLDETKFKAANMSDLKALFSGSGSLADRVAQKASTLYDVWHVDLTKKNKRIQPCGTDRKDAVCAVRMLKERKRRMHRFFVPEENRTENEIVIHGDDVNHIRNVLRMTKGEKIMVSCGKGVDYECEILAVSDSEISLLIRDEKPAVSELPVKITLFQALPKKDKMELVIQKAVELGAASIVPVKTKRCVVKLDAKKEEKKVTRWRTIAESAAKQSGRGVLPEVTAVKSFSEALSMANEMDYVMIPYELCEGMKESVLSFTEASQIKRGGRIGIFIGPEGGFERGEVDAAVAQGIKPISLGKRILRTETAGLAALSILMFLIEGRNEEE